MLPSISEVRSTSVLPTSDLRSQTSDLTAIMHNQHSRAPAKLRAWKSATHLERAPERKKKDGPPPSNP